MTYENVETSAELAFKEERWVDAEVEILKLLEKKGNRVRNAWRLGYVLMKQGKFKEADPFLQEALKGNEKQALKALAATKYGLGDFTWLDENSPKLLEEIKDDYDYISIFAAWALAKGDYRIFTEAMKRINDETLALKPELSVLALKTYRSILEDAQPQEKEK